MHNVVSWLENSLNSPTISWWGKSSFLTLIGNFTFSSTAAEPISIKDSLSQTSVCREWSARYRKNQPHLLEELRVNSVLQLQTRTTWVRGKEKYNRKEQTWIPKEDRKKFVIIGMGLVAISNESEVNHPSLTQISGGWKNAKSNSLKHAIKDFYVKKQTLWARFSHQAKCVGNLHKHFWAPSLLHAPHPVSHEYQTLAVPQVLMFSICSHMFPCF